jgi:hypothetical protein
MKNNCKSCSFDMGDSYENCGASEDGVCPECGYNDNPYKNHPRKSDANLNVIQNYILHLTHCSKLEDCPPEFSPDVLYNVKVDFTPKWMYELAKLYVKEDHVDGRDNPEDEINVYYGVSSWEAFDKEKEYPEMFDVVVDRGEADGTETICSFNMGDDKQSAECLIDFLNGKQS